MIVCIHRKAKVSSNRVSCNDFYPKIESVSPACDTPTIMVRIYFAALFSLPSQSKHCPPTSNLVIVMFVVSLPIGYVMFLLFFTCDVSECVCQSDSLFFLFLLVGRIIRFEFHPNQNNTRIATHRHSNFWPAARVVEFVLRNSTQCRLFL